MPFERKGTKEVVWQQPGAQDRQLSIKSYESMPTSQMAPAWSRARRKSSMAISIASSVATAMLSDEDLRGDVTLQSMFASAESPEGSTVRLADADYTNLTKSQLYEDRNKEVEEWKEEHHKAWKEKKLFEFIAQKKSHETDRGFDAIIRQRLRLEKEAKKERELRRLEEGLPEEEEEEEDLEIRRDVDEISSKSTEEKEQKLSIGLSEELVADGAGVNRALSDWFISEDEMKQLNFDEELLVVDEKLDTRGTWRVQFDLSTQNFFRVVFEGITKEETGDCHAMNHSGWVSRHLIAERDFRVEQFSTSAPTVTRKADESQNLQQNSQYHHYHSDRPKRKNGPRTSAEFRRDSNFNEKRQPGVKKQSKMLYTGRVEGNLWVQTIRRTDDQGQDSRSRRIIDTVSMKNCLSDAAFLIVLRKMARIGFCGKLQAKTMVITGDICPVAIYSHPSRPVKLNGVELQVKRIKRKIITPRGKENISNFFLTSLGQLVAVRHSYDRFGLQIDLNAVLSNENIIPPDRCVPLRKRYKHDPVLNDFFLSQVEEMSYLNELYLHDHPEVMEILGNLLNGLLIDKPHRVVAYVQNYFLRTI